MINQPLEIIKFYAQCCSKINIFALKNTDWSGPAIRTGRYVLQAVDIVDNNIPRLALGNFAGVNHKKRENIVFEPIFAADKGNILFLDDFPPDEVAKLPLDPNILIVQTSPQKFQVHLRFPDKNWTPDEITALQRLVSVIYGCDTCCNVRHPRRLPGYKNCKLHYAPDFPLIEIYDLSSLDREPEDIDALKFDPDKLLVLNSTDTDDDDFELTGKPHISPEQMEKNRLIVVNNLPREGGKIWKKWVDFIHKAKTKGDGELSYSEVDQAYALYLYARDVNSDGIKARITAESVCFAKHVKNKTKYNFDLLIAKAKKGWIQTNDPSRRKKPKSSPLKFTKTKKG